jgi:hypothetical protein
MMVALLHVITKWVTATNKSYDKHTYKKPLIGMDNIIKVMMKSFL